MPGQAKVPSAIPSIGDLQLRCIPTHACSMDLLRPVVDGRPVGQLGDPGPDTGNSKRLTSVLVP
jgi:hypothetical protein